MDHKRNDDNHDLSNLRLLCKHHHDKKTQVEARRGRTRKKLRRPEEAHPGLRRR